MKRAVVLVSGGMDSAVTLAIARAEGYECYALSVNYGQRHESELRAADAVCAMLGAAAHKEVRVDLRAFGGSALTADIDVPEVPSAGVPVTYVPARNTIMLSVALSWAEVLGADAVFCGVNAVDYSGYPDCRPAYIQAFEAMANLATQAAIEGRYRPRGRTPGRRFLAHRVLLPGRRRGPCLRPLRRLPPAGRGFPGSRGAGQHPLSGTLKSFSV